MFRRWTPTADGQSATPLFANPGDNITVEMSFGFQREIIAGLTIASCTVTSAVMNLGIGSITVGTIAIAGPIVTVVLSGGTAGNSYRITFTATLSNGQIRVLTGVLNVVVQ
jgi:hypothetical protein